MQATRGDLLAAPVHLMPGLTSLARFRSSQPSRLRQFRIVVDLDVRPGDEGVAHGAQSGGFSCEALGSHRILEPKAHLHCHLEVAHGVLVDMTPD